ncbi:SDR family oxidoreductase [Mycobacterium sp. MYCO198283]|uniref:SDR family oxidoreductase n=1 Tax=Mycobacterium sp. MYCO198283 TaxID=2883505 RepID=UPI001E5ED699|nr:SDR family oxidoreductase [Mycobacterium sp. MYCO198283]MCG5432679.1 SDR family oxidoreductase [Mycobacterium sp. MYCO198283]
MTPVEKRFVESTDGVRIAAFEQGNPDGPPLVMAHGWPNSHVMWDGVVSRLRDRFRIITYDNRGAGESTVPKQVGAYTMPHFADDFDAVITDLCPGEPVHVLAHDWGSVAVWEYLSRPGAQDRVASFTSISGPSTDHYATVIREGLARPYRPIQFLKTLNLVARLSYWIPFSVPLLMPLAMRAGFGRIVQLANARGVPKDQIHLGNVNVDAANSLRIYRANALRSGVKVRSDHYVTTPVQLLVNTGDPVVMPYGLDFESRWVSRLWRRDIRAGHWSPFSHPQVIAQAVGELVDHLSGGPAPRALLRAEVGRERGPFGDTLVVVTGAGSGIGRETALLFAREGAEVVVSDIDEGSAKETAAQIISRGGAAHPYRVDVSDADAVERFAAEVCDRHGVPDVVVNNAGVGHAGRFLDTPPAEFDRVLEVNFSGVVNGCRSFGRRLVERGTGGHLVNVSSMAAYAPLQSMNAYCTSKAAVFMFSDCLRAELAEAGVGVTTICPGVIDTGIVTRTRIDAPTGKDQAVAPRRAQLQKVFELRGYGPDKVAKAIVSAVRKDKPIRPVAPEAYLLYGTSKLAPQVLRSTARGRVL